MLSKQSSAITESDCRKSDIFLYTAEMLINIWTLELAAALKFMTFKREVHYLNLSWDIEYFTEDFLYSSKIHHKNAGFLLHLK